jgi:bifunctional non-homologous end joining protein LigD
MGNLFDILSEGDKELLEETEQPDWTPPMLATLTAERFSDEAWIYERKLDGERCLAFKSGKDVALKSRNGNPADSSYPEVADAVAGQGSDRFIIDGEIVAFDGAVTSFEKLQPRMHVRDPDEARASGVRVFYYVFDLLYLDGYDVSMVPLVRRKSLLKEAVDFRDPLRYCIHRRKNGMDYFEQACKKGWEGLVVKKAKGPYVHKRSTDWLKFKCVNQQEFVIGGYTDPGGGRIGFGALLVGYYEGGDLCYAGKVGTGYDDELLESLGRRLSTLERKSPPFSGGDPPSRGVHWVTPRVVCEIGFTEWTAHGRLRHPRFVGLRRDKSAKDVVREKPRP